MASSIGADGMNGSMNNEMQGRFDEVTAQNRILNEKIRDLMRENEKMLDSHKKVTVSNRCLEAVVQSLKKRCAETSAWNQKLLAENKGLLAEKRLKSHHSLPDELEKRSDQPAVIQEVPPPPLQSFAPTARSSRIIEEPPAGHDEERELSRSSPSDFLNWFAWQGEGEGQ